MSDLYCCEMEGVAAEAAAASELLECLGYEFSVTTDVDTGASRFTAYFEVEPAACAAADELKKACDGWREIGVSLSSPVIKTLLKEDWTEVWKRHFAVQRISPTLVVRPSWLEHKATPDETVIDLDPGMSFGTGAHETTQFCMKELEILIRAGGKSFLDVGCGSGILTVAAIKLGCGRAACLDNDPECVATTKENFARNGIPESRASITAVGLESFEPGEPFEVVAANIISSVLIAHASRLVSWVAPGGHLIIAGILAREYDEARKAFTAAGLRELRNHTEKEWTGGLFAR